MSFVQNFPFFSIILSLVCAVISFAAGEKRARQLTVFLLTASVIMQASLPTTSGSRSWRSNMGA